MSLLAIALAVATANFSADYDCVLQVPRALNEKDGKVSLDPINFPGVAEGSWKFRLSVRQNRDGLNGEIVWPGNPIQIAGKFAGLVTADGSIAFTTFAAGPCMFTESMCMSLVHLVEQSDGNAQIIILPTALGTNREANTRRPFVAVIEGSCTRTEKSK